MTEAIEDIEQHWFESESNEYVMVRALDLHRMVETARRERPGMGLGRISDVFTQHAGDHEARIFGGSIDPTTQRYRSQSTPDLRNVGAPQPPAQSGMPQSVTDTRRFQPQQNQGRVREQGDRLDPLIVNKLRVVNTSDSSDSPARSMQTVLTSKIPLRKEVNSKGTS